MHDKIPVSPETFIGIQNVDIDKLSELSEHSLRPILPSLVRMSLCAPLDNSVQWTLKRKKILKCLSGIEVVNNLVGLLSIDFHELEQDARKEQQARSKIGGSHTESLVISQLEQGLALEFERSDAARKLRLLLSEMLFILSQVREPRTEFYEKPSELFDSEIYLEEVSDVLCIAQAELPMLLPVTDVAEVLLHVQNGAWLLCRAVANSPDSFLEVCTSLITGGVKQDEEDSGGRRRTETLMMLCEMCPSQMLTIRSLCVEHCQQPGLAMLLTLEHDSLVGTSDNIVSGTVMFVTGLLLDNNVNIRSWFAQFIRGGQKRKDSKSVVQAMREKLLEELSKTVLDGNEVLEENRVIKGCAFIRLYSALKCIAGLKFTEEENQTLLQLVMSHPSLTEAGIRFISLGLCMLLACPHMIGRLDLEQRAIKWIMWLIEEGERFEQASGIKASFGEMLLLIAIHFHNNQNNAIVDLVSSTLGMKSIVKASALTRMRIIFTQEIFTEQVVTSQAVKVSTTANLNANLSGYLPVHCIYQLLKSRAFSKHKVQIKDWIYKQLCSCTLPIHPLIPPLIDAYIHSIILPNAKIDRTNDPITNDEILAVFNDSFEPSFCDPTTEKTASFTTRILLLYYLLLYKDTMLNNMKTIVTFNRPIHRYSEGMINLLPMKYLLQQAQKKTTQLAGIYSSLLGLLATHYPHLCLVADWVDNEVVSVASKHFLLSVDHKNCNPDGLEAAFQQLSTNPSQCIIYLEQLSSMSSVDLVPFCKVVVQNLPRLLEPNVPRQCQDLVLQIWMKINILQPVLKVMTVNILRSDNKNKIKLMDFTEDDITLDPLIVLRCDERVFRCPPLTEMIIRILDTFLQASKSFLSKHAQMNPSTEKPSQTVSNKDREELRVALIAAQESAAIQILLECCLPQNKQEQESIGLLSDWREVQGLVFSHIHQMFILDPSLAKLIHFQGYPNELIPLTVSGIPSMHICLDFIPELIAQPQRSKLIFAIQLVSHLSLQYALPKSMGIAKLVVNVMHTMLSVLTEADRCDFFLATLPALVHICTVFPALCEDAVMLLIQLGRIVQSYLSTRDFCKDIEFLWTSCDKNSLDLGEIGGMTLQDSGYSKLCCCIHNTFNDIVGSTVLLKSQLKI